MSYDLLARFYDLENADFIEDLDFWVDLAKESGGPVLELGCGSGRVTQQIARAGITVAGLDNSPAMLDLARSKLGRKPAVAARATLLAKLTPQETSLEVALGRLTEAINKLTAICPDTPGNPCEPKAS